MSDETKTLVLQLKNGNDRKVIIPKDWAITFGPVAVGARYNGDDSANVLRLYADAGKKELKAVFRNIVAFHEEGITILEKVVRKKTKVFQRSEKNGAQAYSAEIRQTKWRDPYADEDDTDDDLTETALALPSALGEEGEF